METTIWTLKLSESEYVSFKLVYKIAYALIHF